MSKRIMWFSIGFFLSSVIYFLLVYAFGLVLSYFAINLYGSESDQQRNFNIFMGVWLSLSIFVGYLFSKKCK